MGLLADWTDRHLVFDTALAVLRRVVPEGSPDRARQALVQLEQPLMLHMEQEESTLLPVYAEHASAVPANGQPRVYLADHARIRGLLERLARCVGASTAEAILDEQDALCLLAGVLEHHDQRERTWFVPVLDEAVPEPVRRGWIERFEAAEARLPEVADLEPGPAVGWVPEAADPLVALRLAVARDRDVAGAWSRLVASGAMLGGNPRGARLMDACHGLVRQALDSPTRAAHRDCLVTLADRLRLLAIVQAHPPRVASRKE